MSQGTTIRRNLPKYTAARSILALMLREMSSEYGTSPGGYIWAVVQPIGVVIVLAVGFSLLIRAPSLGTSFLLFYATGFMTFNIYNQITLKLNGALVYSRPMLAYPRVTWFDALISRFFLNSLTHLTIFCIVITGVLWFDGARTVISPVPILLGLAISITVGLGAGLMNCLLIGLFPVWKVIWSILSRPMLIASGVLFIYEDMPTGVQNILWFNPVMHASGLVRQGFYPNYHAEYVSLPYCFAFSMAAIACGLLFLSAYHKKILFR